MVEAVRTQGAKVLVVDDDSSLSEMLTIVLRNEGLRDVGSARPAIAPWRRCASSGPTSCCWT